MVLVIKKSGRKQSFSAAKLKKSVMMAAKEAGLSKTMKKRLVTKVVNPVIRAAAKKKTIKSSALRKSILSKLNRYSKAVLKSWKTYERKRRR